MTYKYIYVPGYTTSYGVVFFVCWSEFKLIMVNNEEENSVNWRKKEKASNTQIDTNDFDFLVF